MVTLASHQTCERASGNIESPLPAAKNTVSVARRRRAHSDHRTASDIQNEKCGKADISVKQRFARWLNFCLASLFTAFVHGEFFV
jgi:hypothetical protein